MRASRPSPFSLLPPLVSAVVVLLLNQPTDATLTVDVFNNTALAGAPRTHTVEQAAVSFPKTR